MRFSNASAVQEVVYALRLADYPRGLNRARIASLANGGPPYSEEEERRNNITINASDLGLTRLAHDARQILYNGYFKPGNLFTARTDYGPPHKRRERSSVVSREVNRILKRSLGYYETLKSQFALMVLHGIGPAHWVLRDPWMPEPLGIEDVLMPGNTRLSLNNVPFFAIYRQYTAEELYRLTHGPRVDPGWNLEMAERAIKWAQEQSSKLMGATWAETWSPDKWQETLKSDSGVWASDRVQTLDVFDFFYLEEDDKDPGWRRKVIFDAWGGNGAWQQYGASRTMPTRNLIGDEKGDFLYNGGDRKFADKLSEIVSFQFADLSAVAPFRYHSVRSLGFMLYAVCHLQNRLRCKFSEAVFEQLTMYLRVNSLDDAERALKIELANRGIIDETVKFLSPEERWQPNAQFAEMGIQQFEGIIERNSSSYVQNTNFSKDRTERTKFQVMAEINASTSLVSSALGQAYRYSLEQYYEVFRRFCRPNSTDPDVREFRLRCMKAGVPEKVMTPEAWELEPERVMGSGNKTLEMAIAQQLMEWRSAFAPEAQQQILRDSVLAITDDAARAAALVPESPGLSDARHDAMLAYGSLMAGGRVEFTADQSRIEIVETLLSELALGVGRVQQAGGMASMEQVGGFQNVAAHVAQLIGQVAQDKAGGGQQRAKGYQDGLRKVMNLVKGFAQRLAEQQRAQEGNGGIDPKDRAKIMATMLTAQAKAKNMLESHGARTAQKQVQFEEKLKQQKAEKAQELGFKAREAMLDVHAKDLQTAAEIRRGRMRAFEE